MKKIISLFLSVVMLLSVTAGVDLSAYADDIESAVQKSSTVLCSAAQSFEKNMQDSLSFCQAKLSFLSETADKIMRKAADFVSSFSFNTAALSSTADISNYKYSQYSDGTLKITGYTGSASVLDIPSEINGKAVTGIAEKAFYNCTSLTNVVVPNSVTSIGESAFEGCSSLEEMTLPFTGSSANATEDSCNTHFGYIFGYTYRTKDYYSPYHYFYRNCNLFTYKIPSPLKKVTITGSKILPFAFMSYNNAEIPNEIVISQNVKSIGRYAFSYSKVNYLGTVEEWAQIDFEDSSASPGSKLYINGELLTDLKLQSEMKPYAFDGCKLLQSVELGDGVTNVPYGVFQDCTGLQSIKFGSSLKSISSNAFYNCSSLTNVVIPNSVISIGESAFEGCSSLEEISLPFTGSSAENTKDYCDNYYFNTNYYDNHLGYIFGYTTKDTNNYREPHHYNTHGNKYTFLLYTYKIPSTLKKVTITGDKILPFAFSDGGAGLPIEELTVSQNVKKKCSYAFYSFSKLLTVYYSGTIEKWSQIQFDGGLCNYNLYINDELLTDLKLQSEMEPYAFSGCKSLQSVELGDGITNVPYGVFQNCTNLETLNLGNRLKSISQEAFYNCPSLTNVVVPNSVTSIGESAFEGCSSLTEISLPFTGVNIGRIESSYDTHLGYIFGYDEIAKRYGSDGDKQSYHYFDGDSTVYTYHIPSTLKKVTITGDKILPYAFYGGTAGLPIEEITISESVKKIGGCAFYTEKNDNLKNIKYSGTADEWAQIDFENYSSGAAGHNLYIESQLLTKIILNNDIKPYAFCGCKSLESVELRTGVTNVSAKAFYNCTSLTKVIVPNSVASIGESAFEGCSSLMDIEFPNNLTTIGKSAFAGCSGMTEINVPDSVTSIGSGAFSGCSAVQKISLPFVGLSEDSSSPLFGDIFGSSSYEGSVKTIQYYKNNYYSTYYIPASLKSVSIDHGSLKYGSFYNCSGISEITFGKEVHYAGKDAFYNCTGLSKVNYLGTIDDWAQFTFENAAANPAYYTKKLYINSSPVSSANLVNAEKASANSFYNNEFLETVIMSDTVKTIEAGSFANCKNLKNLVIGEGVTKIESGAFSECNKLVHIYYKGTEENWSRIKCDDGIISKAIVHFNADDNDISHIWDSGVLTREPTCTEKGVRTYTCTLCGEELIQYIPENGHSYDEGTVITEPTNYKYGEMEYSCTVCGYKNREPIAKIPPATDGITDSEVYGSAGYGYSVLIGVNAGSPSGSVYCGSARLMKPGDTLTVTASGEGTCNDITWLNSGGSIQVISGGTRGSSRAVIKAVRPGTGWINGVYWSDIYTKPAGYCNNAYAVKVVNPLDNIYFFETDISLKPGEEYEIGLESGNVCYEPYSRYSYAVTGVNFITSDESVATIDSEGKIKAVGYGTCEISIQTNTGLYAGAELTVMCDNHSFRQAVTKNPTCTQNGILEKTCRTCGYKITETIPKKGHTEVTDAAVAPTCTKSGLTEGIHCSVCDSIIVEQEMINPTGHRYTSILTAPSCTEQGYTEHTCQKCGNTYKDNYTNALGHNFGSNNKTCSVCGANNPNYVEPTKPAKPSNPQPSAPTQQPTPIQPAQPTAQPSTTAVKVSKPKSAKISKLTNGKKSFKASWSKVSGVTGYQIQYSTSKKFTKKTTKSVTVKGSKKTSATVKKLKSKKKYYVRIRTYKTVNGKKFYSLWSKVKMVMTK